MKLQLFVIISFLILTSSLYLAQEDEKKEIIINKTNTIKKFKEVETTGSKMSVKDGATTLIEITNEGSAGSIFLPSVGSVLSGSRLYNNGSNLFWGDNQLGTTGNAGGWTRNGTNVFLTALTDLVGLGTIAPAGKLHISSSSSSWGMFRLENSNTGQNEVSISFKEGSDATAANLWLAGVGLYGELGDFIIGRNGLKFILDYEGNLGLGTPSPSQKLDVDYGNIVVQGINSFTSSGHEGIVYLGSVHHYIKGVHGTGIKIGTYAVGDVVTIEELSGDVGIGTTDPVADLHVNGDIYVTGANRGNLGPNNGAPFPRPAYDSGWKSISSDKTFTHNLGGNVDNYVVDLQIKNNDGLPPYTKGIYQPYYDTTLPEPPTVQVMQSYGAYWSNLTTSTIKIRWGENNFANSYVRTRIWIYN